MTNKSILDNWEEEIRNMVYEVWTSHSSSKYMVELVGKLLQAQRERDAEIVKDIASAEYMWAPGSMSEEIYQKILNQNNQK